MADQTIIERIAKLFALARDEGAAEGEADNALRMAQKLMAKHELDMATVDGVVSESKVTIGQDDMEVEMEREHWKTDLYWRIGCSLGCVGYHQKHTRAHKRLILIGSDNKLALAKLITEWVVPQLVRECDKALLDERESRRMSGPQVRVFRNNFYSDASQTIAKRVKANQTVALADDDNSMALVRVEDDKLDDYLDENDLGFARKTKKVGRALDYGARAHGRNAGNRADINPGNKVSAGGRVLLNA